jgi:uncharacterized membrane protein required for colicin V production
MNLLDIILAFILGISIFEGLRRGLTRQLMELGGIIAAFIIASRHGVAFGQVLSGILKLEEYASTLNNPFLNVDAVATILYNSLGYFLLFAAVLIATKLIAIALGVVAKLPVIGTVDKLGGMVAGLLKGAFIALVLVWILNLLPIPAVMEAVDSSRVAQVFLGVAPGIYQRLKDMMGAGLMQG